jgi:hypothetical protein
MMSFLLECMLQVTESWRLMFQSRRTTRSYLLRMHRMFWKCTGCNTWGVENFGCFSICLLVSSFCLLQSSICFNVWPAVLLISELSLLQWYIPPLYETLMPRNPLAWCAWNFLGMTSSGVSVTYWLQVKFTMSEVHPATLNSHLL